jgi:hypothetical protein
VPLTRTMMKKRKALKVLKLQLKQLLLNKLYLNGYEEVPHCRFGQSRSRV